MEQKQATPQPKNIGDHTMHLQPAQSSGQKEPTKVRFLSLASHIAISRWLLTS